MLPKHHRLTDEFDFRAVKKYGKTVHTQYFVLNYFNKKHNTVRVGFIASSKVGGAVQRNRAVRLLRESIKELVSEIKLGADIVIIARSAILTKKTHQVVTVMQKALDDAGLREYARIQDENPE